MVTASIDQLMRDAEVAIAKANQAAVEASEMRRLVLEAQREQNVVDAQPLKARVAALEGLLDATDRRLNAIAQTLPAVREQAAIDDVESLVAGNGPNDAAWQGVKDLLEEQKRLQARAWGCAELLRPAKGKARAAEQKVVDPLILAKAEGICRTCKRLPYCAPNYPLKHGNSCEGYNKEPFELMRDNGPRP